VVGGETIFSECQPFASWQDSKMVEAASGSKMFVAALHVQKYSGTNCTCIVSSKYNHSTTKGLVIR
jgi:hypothetical protein